MTTTATVDSNEGWIFPNTDLLSNEFPTTTPPDDGWNVPAAPSPPSSTEQPRQDDHASLHWTACYDDYCNTHRQMKNNNYYPRQSRRHHRRRRPSCDCPLPHPEELLAVTRERRLNPVKACADWHRGKRVCPDCRFLVNTENHHLRCSATAPREPPADIPPPQEDHEETPDNLNEAATMAAAIQEERLTLLGEIVTTIHQTTTQDARRNHAVHRALAQRMNEFHDADQQQLQRMASTLETIIAEQQRINGRLQARQRASRAIRIHRTPIRRHPIPTPRDLAGASVWTGDVLSRTWRDRLSGAAAGATIAFATLWLILVSAAAATVILRA